MTISFTVSRFNECKANIRLDDEGFPYMKYDECWYCGVCEEDCPEEAVVIDLPFLVR